MSGKGLSAGLGNVVMTLLACFLISQTAFSQTPKRANIWYFGEQAGLDFTQGHPVPLTNGAMQAFEGSAVMSDLSGNLLFYTNGGDMPYPGGIWNRNHQIMPNGNLDGKSGCGSSFQSSIIVPHPKYEELYYLFTTDCVENNSTGGLRYSIIDMTLDGGLGDVTAKDILLTTPVDESLTAIQHANGQDYWIVSHKLRTDSFYVYHLSPQGIVGLVKSKVGPVTPDYAGAIKASINGEKLVYSGLNFTALFDFNAGNGLVTNHVDLGIPSYSACFSPNCELLYVADGVNKRLFQFDLISHDVPATLVQVGATSSIGLGGMQLGPDDRIYIARFVTSQYLGVIMNPDVGGDDCNYVDDGIHLAGKNGKGGVPNFPNNMIGECQSYPVENISDYSQFLLKAKSIGSSNFMLEWRSGEMKTNYAVLFKRDGTERWQKNIVQTNAAGFENLEPATTYKVRVLSLFGSNYQPLLNHFTDERIGRNSLTDEKMENEIVVTTLNELDFSMYPNPASVSTTLSVDFGSNPTTVDVYVMEASGKIIKEYNYDAMSGSKEFAIPIHDLTNGIYHIAVQTDETYKVQKLIVLK